MKLHPRPLASLFVTAALAAGTLFTTQAQACGAFACSTSQPVNQAAERIIFAQDEENNVTQIVEVMYAGDAEKFAWVLPVPGKPTPGVSSVDVFNQLQQATNPNYQLINDAPSRCGIANGFGSSNDVALSTEAPRSAGLDTGIQVVDSGNVGPFDYVTISVDPDSQEPADVALEWLRENEYDVTADTAKVLGPYLANGLNLIAFRLQKGAFTGSIRPISLEYQARTMAIPILPTSLAAEDDMPIMVWTLGKSRAVSTNYRSLELNELLIDWTNPGPTYNDVVIAAANEAGGHGFVTEFCGDAAPLSEVIGANSVQFAPEDYNSLSLEDALVALTNDYGRREGFVDAVRLTLPLREGVTAESFVSCAQCYFDDLDSNLDGTESESPDATDPLFSLERADFYAAIREQVIDPIDDAAALFEKFDKVTRLYTTMSAEEMTEDPVFEFNPELKDYSNQHTATREVTCEGASGDWKVTLPDGREVFGSGRSWPYAPDTAEMPANLRVLQYSATGEADVITDNYSKIEDIHQSTRAGSGRKNDLNGCTMGQRPHTPSMAWLAGLLAAGLLVTRRRHGKAQRLQLAPQRRA